MSVLTGGDMRAILAILDSIGAPITLTDLHEDGSFRVFLMNRLAEAFYGVSAGDLVGLSLREMGLRPVGRLERIEERFRECIASGSSVHFRDHSPVDTRQGRRWVNITMTPLIDEAKGITRIMSTIIDVTELRRYEEELADALTKILSGFVSICAACKKIEDDETGWTPVEGYISKRSGARFTHGMCPECFDTWYGEHAEE
ncbi:MAG TPA: PAS domain S-box protein [Longimicrobiales bacterium]|nr:PAS domain S-box protein [Longimicrobiales bacterium]